MYRIIDFLLYTPLVFMCLFAWKGNLYQSALLAGRTFFAFLFSMWLFSPFSTVTKRVLPLPLPYLNAFFFLVIWIMAFVLIKYGIMRVCQPRINRMRFVRSGPGKIIMGLIAGWILLNSLTAFMVMIPEVEGIYFENKTHPWPERDRRSSFLFSYFTLTKPDILLAPQMEACAFHVKREIAEKDGKKKFTNIEEIPEYFEMRYRSHWTDTQTDMRRQHLHLRLLELLQEQKKEE